MGNIPISEECQNANLNSVPGVNVGNVTGGIHNAIIAGGNIYTRSQLEELRDYLRSAVTTYAMTQLAHLYKQATPPSEPYKFLDSFAIEDAEMFFGRDEVSAALHEKVIQNRMTVLHAKSGAGKTSLLQAGLAPRLLREGCIPIFARAYNDPVLAVKQKLAPVSGGAWPELLHKISLADLLGEVRQVLPPNVRELVLIFDQFEEFFVFWPLREQRQSFIEDFARCYDDANLPVRFLIAIRKDYYSDLAEFEWRIPTMLRHQVWLPTLTRQQATQAITTPVAKLGQPITYTPQLLDVLLGDLASSGMELPHLQVICTKLFEGAEMIGMQQIDLPHYERLGQASGILANYLTSTLVRFPNSVEAIAKAILKELVSSEATKRVLARDTLSRRLQAEPSALNDALTRLVNARLLRRDEVDGEIVYEMAHEYLIAEIKQWIDVSDFTLKHVQELLEREVANWRIYRTLIPDDRLKLIHAERNRLGYVDDVAGECLLRSVLSIHDEMGSYAIEDWMGLLSNTSTSLLLAVWNDATDYFQRLEIISCLGTAWRLPDLARLGNKDSYRRHLAAEELGELGDARVVEPLIAVLKDENWKVRTGAARSLGQLGDVRAVDPLIAVLNDENENVRKEAIQALGQLGNAAVEPLIAALKHEDEDGREKVAQALVQLGDAAVDPLINVLKDENKNIRMAAAVVLRQLGDAVVDPLIANLKDGNENMRMVAAAVLGQLGDARAVDPLINALKDENKNMCMASAVVLGQLGDARAVGPLIAALNDPSGNVRRAATQALGQLGDARVVDLLIAVLKDENENVRKGATQALGQLGDAHAVEPLITVLKDENENVRKGATQALGQLGDARAVEPLIAALNDEHENVRMAATQALGQLGDVRAVDPLIAVLKDENKEKHKAEFSEMESLFGIFVSYKNEHKEAAQALGQLGDARALEPLITVLKDQDQDMRTAATQALGQLGDARAVEPLIAALKDPSENVRMAAVQVLGQLSNEAVEPLIATLKDKDANARRGSTEALSHLGDPRALEPLITVLKDQDQGVRTAATQALGQLRDARAAEPLIAVLKDPSETVRMAAVQALGQLGDNVVEPLIATLKDEDANVRWGATEALRHLGDPRMVDPLIAVLKDKDMKVRKGAVITLGHFGDAAVDPLIAILKDENAKARWGAAEALGRLRDARAVEPLIATLKDKNAHVRWGAVEALRKLGNTAIESLIATLKDKDAKARIETLYVLGRLGDARAVELLIIALKDSNRAVRKQASRALRAIGTREALIAVESKL